MDEWTLNDLLECSVCLDRLDTSSKVLPCQHTFCRKCLEEIVSTHKELRCPECRVLVDCRIEELPPNVLLMRILEGMRNNAGPKKYITVGNRTTQNVHVAPTTQTTQPVPVTIQQPPPSSPHIQISDHVNVQQVKALNYSTQPYARAVYDYLSNEPGDLNFRKGDIIILHNRIDSNWCHGECEGVKGVFPLTYVQVMMPLPSHIPQCRALYDFRMTNDEEDGCLTFSKGEIITVIRRIDENWAEGKLLERVGIFPLAFVELNNVARALMKLSSNVQPGPSRLAPPTPTCEDTTPLIPTDHSHTITKSDCSPYHHDPFISTPHHQIPNTVTVQRLVGNSDSSSTVSSSSSVTTPNTSSGSSSSTAPSSPTSSPPARTTYSQSNVTVSSSVVSTTSPPHVVQPREKRHSFSILHSGHHHPSNRHSAEILSPNESTKHEDQSQPQANGEMTGRHYRASLELNSSSQPPQQGSPRISGCAAYLPAAYIALYPYKPQKADELELKKGSIYMVTERCQDGWFRGTSGRTQKCGVFPGNYVTPVKSLPSLARGPPHGGSSSGGNSSLSPHSGLHHSESRHSGSCSPRQRSMLYGIGSLVPPELPPRSCSPAQPLVSTSWHGQPQTEELVALGRSPSAVVSSDTAMVTSSPASICTSAAPPSVLGQSSSTSGKSSEKVKEKKEGKTGLMWRLANMKKCKSPPPTTYSVDNPVFEDAVINPSPAHHVHVRSGSCPSQLLQVLPVDVNSAHHRLFGTGSQRLKHKERPAIITSHLASSGRIGEVNAAACVPTSHHRKSNSLDASCIEMVKKGNKQPSIPVRERFRCIVPYPPNSEYELELRVGDIIHVHKKRDDGWYKGTQQRTGRTGLFPASFVESC